MHSTHGQGGGALAGAAAEAGTYSPRGSVGGGSSGRSGTMMRGRGRGRGDGRGRGGFGMRGGRGRGREPEGPPDSVVAAGTYMHPVEGSKFMLLRATLEQRVPMFNAPIYLENKAQIGIVDEVLGPINEVYFSVKPTDGVVASSFKTGSNFFINPMKTLPVERFLPQPKAFGVRKPSGKGAGTTGSFTPRGRGAPRGSFGAPRGSFGSPRGSFGTPRGSYGAPRGSFGSSRGSYGAPRGRGGY